jgi:eukaryotic-like serine/threonine-protein kinase
LHHEEAGPERRSREAVRTVDESTQVTAGPGADEPAGERRVLGRYRLARRIGSGGFGVVWLAEDEHLRRAVAVKRIVMHDPAVAARAEREGRAAARLSHPGIVALYESGRDDEAVYLVSELVRGRTLAQLMEEGELSDRDVLRVGVALCDALAHAHGRGVIHRDVKPGNVIVPDRPQDGHGVAKLTDFGIARMIGDDALTATGDVVGTLAYMAPEQADGRAAGEEADLYALALVLYEALSGVNPVRGRGAASTARRLGARLPPLGRLRRDLPLELCQALDRAVLPRPEQRGTLGQLRDALADALPAADDERGTIAGSPLEGLARVGGDGIRPKVRPRMRVVAALAAGGLAAAAVAWLTPRAGAEASPAAAGAAAAVAVLLMPRVGWVAMVAALAAWSSGPTAAVVGLAAAPTVLLLRRSGGLWSLPAGAPLLGVVGLAGAWPALAGQAVRPWHRAALGALGGWWLILAEILSGKRLALGAPPDAALAGTHLMPLLTSGVLAVAALWAAAAVLLPLLVRGRALAADVVGATTWAAGLGSATQAVAGALSWQPAMRGVVASAVVAGGLAVVVAASRGDAYRRSGS